MIYITVFAATALLDYVWARYIAGVASKRRALASTMASGLVLLSGFVTVMYVGDPWLLVPAALGAWVGTWVGVE